MFIADGHSYKIFHGLFRMGQVIPSFVTQHTWHQTRA